MAIKYYNELREISLVKSETRLTKISVRQREGEYLIRLLSLGWCFEWLQVAIIGQDSVLSVRQVEMNEALSHWRLKFITVTFQFFWLGWFRPGTELTIPAADPTRSGKVWLDHKVNSLKSISAFRISLSLSLSVSLSSLGMIVEIDWSLYFYWVIDINAVWQQLQSFKWAYKRKQ